MHFPVYGVNNSSVLRIGCEVLRKKNNQSLKRVRFYKEIIRPIFPEKEYGVLDSEIYSARRRPSYTTMLLDKSSIQLTIVVLLRKCKLFCE